MTVGFADVSLSPRDSLRIVRGCRCLWFTEGRAGSCGIVVLLDRPLFSHALFVDWG
jgi:hypothetical protein